MDTNKQLESEVMAKIKSGQIKLRSKYIFLAEKLGLGSAFILSVLLAVLFFSLVLFYLRASDNLFYLSFGSVGLFAFLESFPYLLVISLIILIFVAGLIIKKSDITYQKPFGYLALALVGFILIAGVGLALTNIAEMVQRSSLSIRPMGMMLSPFGAGEASEGNRGVAGRITEVGNGYALVQTPNNITKLNITDDDIILPEVGQFIVAVGARNKKEFNVEMIHQVDPAQMQMVRNNVHRKFGPLDQGTIDRGHAIKSCLDNCPKLKLAPKDCGERCFGTTTVATTTLK